MRCTLLLLAAATQWRLQSFDATGAGLHGEQLPPERVLYMRLPRRLSDAVVGEVRTLLGKGHRTDMARIRKGAFGLAESPRLWCQRARAIMLELGFRESRLVPCVVSMWGDPDARGHAQLKALVSLHIDDGLAACTAEATMAWQQPQGRLRLSA